MTNEPSPRPWRVADYAQCPVLADVFDASGSPSGLVTRHSSLVAYPTPPPRRAPLVRVRSARMA